MWLPICMFRDWKRGSHVLSCSPDTRHTLGSVTWTSRNGPFRASPGCDGQNMFPSSLQAACYPPSCSLCGFSFHIFTYAICWLASLGSFTWFTSPSRLLLDKTKLSWRLSWTDKYAKWYPFPKYQSSIQRMTEPEETSGQCGTWTSLDENRQEILLDVCPSIHLWKIAVMGWKTGSKRNIMYFGDRCPTHHSHPGRTFPLMWLLSNPWCSKWHARDERNVSRQNSGRRGSPMGMMGRKPTNSRLAQLHP